MLLVFACGEGTTRGCERSCAAEYGADWVIVQTDYFGKPYRCWELRDVAVSDDDDNLVWLTPGSGNIISINEQSARVQVDSEGWDEAYAELGLTRDSCQKVQELRYNVANRSYE